MDRSWSRFLQFKLLLYWFPYKSCLTCRSFKLASWKYMEDSCLIEHCHYLEINSLGRSQHPSFHDFLWQLPDACALVSPVGTSAVHWGACRAVTIPSWESIDKLSCTALELNRGWGKLTQEVTDFILAQKSPCCATLANRLTSLLWYFQFGMWLFLNTQLIFNIN